MCPPEVIHAAPAPLSIGPAIAVLATDVPDDPVVRTAVAQARLRQATRRGDIVITRRPSGRPRLDPPYPELGVSLSHRGDVLLVAICSAGTVGCDVEIDDPSLDGVRLSRDHFAACEAKAIARRSTVEARDMFWRLWVAKEAVLKVTGRGIHDGMDEPNASAHLDDLVGERPFRLAAGSRSPAARVMVRRLSRQAMPTIYCALAVTES